jgi:hypothetical protein
MSKPRRSKWMWTRCELSSACQTLLCVLLPLWDLASSWSQLIADKVFNLHSLFWKNKSRLMSSPCCLYGYLPYRCQTTAW